MNQDKLKDQFIFQVGRITLNFAMLENMIAHELAGFISKERDFGFLFTADIQMSKLITTLNNVIVYKIDPKDTVKQKMINSLTRELNYINEKRNQIIHSYWIVIDFPKENLSSIEGGSRQAKSTKGLKKTGIEYSIDELIAFNNRISDAYDDVVTLRRKIGLVEVSIDPTTGEKTL